MEFGHETLESNFNFNQQEWGLWLFDRIICGAWMEYTNWDLKHGDSDVPWNY